MMKHLKTILILIVLICLAGPVTSVLGQNMMSIQVKKGQLRSTPSFLGEITTTVYYGDRVEIIEQKGAWNRVRPSGTGTGGWIHASALTQKRIELKAGAADVRAAADSDELALAGKGFNKQVEGEFRSKNPNIDFYWVDKMEAMEVPPHEIQAFLEEGGLSLERRAHE